MLDAQPAASLQPRIHARGVQVGFNPSYRAHQALSKLLLQQSQSVARPHHRMAMRALLVCATAASAFLGAPPQPVAPPAVPPAVSSQACETSARRRTRRGGALDDLAATAQDLLSKLSPAPAAYNASNVKPGNIVRCGAKAQNQSRVKGWTTNKPSVPGFVISSTGCGNDYNHCALAASFIIFASFALASRATSTSRRWRHVSRQRRDAPRREEKELALMRRRTTAVEAPSP